MPFPTDLAPAVPLERVTDDRRALAALAELRDHGADALVGLDEATVPILARAATEPAIVEFCPNDAARFGDVPAARRWAAKGRGFVAVVAPGAADLLLAYGWSGVERNEHVPGADVTTAYRVTAAGQRLARSLRAGAAPGFRLGLLLGELVIGTAVALGGVPGEAVSLETWASNDAARRLYADLGFREPEGTPELPALRPTLLPVGAAVAGARVRVDPADPSRRVVDDRRCFYVLRRGGA